MRRIRRTVPLLALCLIISGPAHAQEEFDPIGEFLQFVEAPENQQWVSQFLKEPVEGQSTFADPTGDFVHSSGDQPGYTPDFIDFYEAWAIDMPMVPSFVGPVAATPDGSLFNLGENVLQNTSLPLVRTLSSDSVAHDGSQFAGGAWFFGVELSAPPPAIHPGRCEFMVWAYDAAMPQRFEVHPNFPLDPAGGTNKAFGIGMNPDGGIGTFSLELTGDGFFRNAPEYDVRAFQAVDYVGILVPKTALTDPRAVNFYTFCVEEGFSFSSEDTGSDQSGLLTIDPASLGVMEVSLVSTTTTTQATTTTTEATTTTVSSTVTTAPVAAAPGSAAPWILIVAGLGLAGLGWFLFNKKKGPCDDLLAAWMAAQAECDRAKAEADQAVSDCQDAKDLIEDLEDDRNELCQTWPPACWKSEEGSWVEDAQGNRVTSRDLHLKKMALGEIWDDYQAGNLTAQEVEAKWKEADTPEFREEMREQDAMAREQLEQIDSQLAEARQKEQEACERAEQAKTAAEKACAEADAARRRYEECIGQAGAPTGEPGGTGETGGEPVGPGGPAVAGGGAEPARDPCEGQPSRKVEPAGGPDRIRVNVDFSVIIGRMEGSERNVAAGEQMTLGFMELARDIDFVGDMLNARSAGLHIRGAVNGYAAGRYVATGAGVVQGGIDAVMATTDLLPEVPTTPLQAGVEGMEALAKLGGIVSGKVTEWMSNYQIMTVRRSFFYQDITATPYTVWECRSGVGWVCVEKVWEIEVGTLKVQKGEDRWFTINSDVRRLQFQREINRLTQSAINKIRSDAQRLAEWRARHEPGPC